MDTSQEQSGYGRHLVAKGKAGPDVVVPGVAFEGCEFEKLQIDLHFQRTGTNGHIEFVVADAFPFRLINEVSQRSNREGMTRLSDD